MKTSFKEKVSNKCNDLKIFIKSLKAEITHLKIPSKAETIASLIVVLFMALISSVIFFSIDVFSFRFITYFVNLFC